MDQRRKSDCPKGIHQFLSHTFLIGIGYINYWNLIITLNMGR